MKTKIIIILISIILIGGTITGLSITISKQKEKIENLEISLKKSEMEILAFEKTIDDFKKIEDKYKGSEPSISEDLTNEVIADFNNLFKLWLSNND